MLFGATVRATLPHAAITARRVPRLPGLVAADFRDVPGRNLVALIDDDQPCLAEHEVRHVAEPVLLLAHADRDRLADAVAAVAVDYAPLPAVADPLASTRVVQGHRDRQGRPRPRDGRGRTDRRGRIPHRAPGAALHRDQRGHRRAVDRAGVRPPAAADAGHDRLRLAAVPVLRPPGAGRGARPAARAGAGGADRDRRRLRRQGRVPVGAGVPRGDPRRQGRRAGEDDLRPGRGSAGHHQAASGDRPASAPASPPTAG